MATASVPADAPPRAADSRITYISWAESCSRSDHTARELSGRSHMVYLPGLGSRASTVLFKYIGQWIKTLRILRDERPDVVFVMTPPLVAAMPAFLYAWRRGKQVVLDAHSAAFLHPRWRRLQWLQSAMCRRAATTLVHNDHIAAHVRDIGGHATVVPDVPVIFDTLEPFPRPAGFTIAVVCSFNYDEPVPVIVEAARAMPDVHFYMTGNPRHLDPAIAANLPENMQLTGFLSTEAYGGLLTGADAVLTLTTRDHTMLRGAYEAIYQGTPVIVSDWPLLRDAFTEGAVHVDNTALAITRAVSTIRDAVGAYRAGAARLRQQKYQRWLLTMDAIKIRLASAAGAVGDSRRTEAET